MADSQPLSVVFCWAEVSGYMPACWRELAARPGVRCHVLHPQQIVGTPPNPFHLGPLLAGVSHEMFQRSRPNLEQWLLEAVRAQQPDVIVMCGWIFWPYVSLASAPELAGTRIVLGMDTPWLGTLRQRLGRLRLGGLIARSSAMIIASERSAEYARRLGVPDDRIHKGYYGFDHRPLERVADDRRAAGAWPRQFLFVGRYAPEKDLGTLIRAYQLYRSRVSNPWGLTCCGIGPDAHLLAGAEGVTDEGFLQPADLPGVFQRHGAFVLPSKFEPWGVVIAEAAATGLPIVCTNACGASDDLVRSYYNGLITGAGSVESLARAFHWIHDHEAELPVMGERSRQLAEPYSSANWAARWHQYLLNAVADGR